MAKDKGGVVAEIEIQKLRVILLVVSKNHISRIVREALRDHLLYRGFDAIVLGAVHADQPVSVFALDDLSSPEIEEIRRIVLEAQQKEDQRLCPSKNQS